ncbi:hypothetical protein B0H63DRAFT_534818, partial [Podospora didyma]
LDPAKRPVICSCVPRNIVGLFKLSSLALDLPCLTVEGMTSLLTTCPQLRYFCIRYSDHSIISNAIWKQEDWDRFMAKGTTTAQVLQSLKVVSKTLETLRIDVDLMTSQAGRNYLDDEGLIKDFSDFPGLKALTVDVDMIRDFPNSVKDLPNVEILIFTGVVLLPSSKLRRSGQQVSSGAFPNLHTVGITCYDEHVDHSCKGWRRLRRRWGHLRNQLAASDVKVISPYPLSIIIPGTLELAIAKELR